jgi:hypothetical protein
MYWRTSTRWAFPCGWPPTDTRGGWFWVLRRRTRRSRQTAVRLHGPNLPFDARQRILDAGGPQGEPRRLAVEVLGFIGTGAAGRARVRVPVDLPEQKVGGERHAHPVSGEHPEELHGIRQHRRRRRHDLVGAGEHRQQVRLDRGDVIGRDPVHHRVGGPQSQRCRLPCLSRQQVVIGQPDRLARSGGPGGEHQQGKIVRGGRMARTAPSRGMAQLLDRRRPQPDVGQILLARLGNDHQRVVEQRSQVLQPGAPPARTGRRRDRARHDTAQHASPEGTDETLRIIGGDQRAVAGGKAMVEQTSGNPVCALPQLGIGQERAVDERDAARRVTSRTVEQLRERRSIHGQPR